MVIIEVVYPPSLSGSDFDEADVPISSKRSSIRRRILQYGFLGAFVQELSKVNFVELLKLST